MRIMPNQNQNQHKNCAESMLHFMSVSCQLRDRFRIFDTNASEGEVPVGNRRINKLGKIKSGVYIVGSKTLVFFIFILVFRLGGTTSTIRCIIYYYYRLLR